VARELHVDEALPPEYWEQLGMEGEQAKPGDPFSSPPPGAGANPFEGYGGPSGRSRYQAGWLKTRKGVEFIDVFVGEAPGSDDTHMLIFLYEGAPGRWAVGFSRPKTVEGGEFPYKDVTYEQAKRHAEEEAAAMSVDAGTNADWRQDIPGAKQVALVQRIGLPYDEATDSKGSLSDKLNVHFASRTLDPHFAPTRS
jgi:hypothetical protein